MQANLYLKMENITSEERKEMEIAINIMKKISDEYSKVYGRSDALGFDIAIGSIESILNGELF